MNPERTSTNPTRETPWLGSACHGKLFEAGATHELSRPVAAERIE